MINKRETSILWINRTRICSTLAIICETEQFNLEYLQAAEDRRYSHEHLLSSSSNMIVVAQSRLGDLSHLSLLLGNEMLGMLI
jgi:hypothetical protein